MLCRSCRASRAGRCRTRGARAAAPDARRRLERRARPTRPVPDPRGRTARYRARRAPPRAPPALDGASLASSDTGSSAGLAGLAWTPSGSARRPQVDGPRRQSRKAPRLRVPSAEIYGGFRSTWDYGPLGVLLKRNVKDAWWRSMVQLRDDVVGLDAAILMAPKVWEASGHVATFTDPLVDCRNCKERFRADQLPSRVRARTAARRTPHRGPPLQPDVQDLRRPGGGRRLGRVPAARDRPGHLRQLQERADHDAQEAAVRHRADRQVVPQRDHAGQLHLPHARVRADGDGVLRPARRRAAAGSSTGSRERYRWYIDLGIPEPTCCASARTIPRSCPTTRPAPPTSSSRSRGAGASSRASPTAPTTT